MKTPNKWEASLSGRICEVWWQTSDVLIIAIMTYCICMQFHVNVSFRCCFFLVKCITFFQLRTKYNHCIRSHITPVLTSDPHRSTLSHETWETIAFATPKISFCAQPLLLFIFLSVCLSLSVCTTALVGFINSWKLLYAHYTLDQSSLVIGQREFRQRKKEAPATSEDTPTGCFDRFSKELTFAAVSGALGVIEESFSPGLLTASC